MKRIFAALILLSSPLAAQFHASSYTPHRVYRTDGRQWADFESMLADLAWADVVFLGEQHDDPATHRLELATLQGLTRRRGQIVLSLEMFERDVQPALDAYLRGDLSDSAFAARSRPWPRYETDYAPMVRYAQAWRWPVLAANVPRRIASAVGRGGLAAIDTTFPDRIYAARDKQCPPDDAYARRFAATMGDMRGHGQTQITPEQAKAMVQRFYLAQCVKDETMAESIADALQKSPRRSLVLHVNGAFHSDYRQGTAARVARRLGAQRWDWPPRVAVVSFVPVDDLDRMNPRDHRKLGDYVVFTLKPKLPPNHVPAP